MSERKLTEYDIVDRIEVEILKGFPPKAIVTSMICGLAVPRTIRAFTRQSLRDKIADHITDIYVAAEKHAHMLNG